MPSQEFRENIQVTCCGMIMVKANFDRVLHQLHRRAPFWPFDVELLNGDHVEVDHPEALIVRGGTSIFVAADGTTNGRKKSRRERG